MISWRLLSISMTVFLGVLSEAGAQSLAYRPVGKKTAAPATTYGIGFGYSGGTDALEEGPRVYSHELRISPSVKFTNSMVVSAFGTINYESVERETIHDEQNPGWGDSGLVFVAPIKLSPLLTLSNSIAEVFPTSEISRTEGYRSIVALKTALPLRFPKVNTTFTNALGLTYIFNTEEYSLLTKTANPLWSLGYSLTASYNFNKNWFVGLGGDARSTRFMDDVSRFRASNSAFAGFNWQAWSTRVSYSNGVVPDRATAINPALDSLEVLQIDEYRQIIGWELSCSF